MSKVLYINGNPQVEQYSYSRRVGRHLLNRLEGNSDYETEVVNVYESNVPLIDQDVLSAWGALGSGGDFNELTEDQQAKVGRMSEILQAFKEADEYVFVTPMWNFSVPPMLKAYTDNVLIAGETFKYTAEGPVGLLGDKKATIIQASGGVYSEGPGAAMDHGANYLQTILGFMGVTDVTTIGVEGIAVPGKSEEERLSEAFAQVDAHLETDRV